MAPESVRRRVLARGRVQGVFFRDSVRRQAQAEGVAGWVRNRDDGAVEAVFEGSPEAVARMVEFSRSGPGHADVEDLQVNDEQSEGLDGFQVR